MKHVSLSSMPMGSMGICFTTHASMVAVCSLGSFKKILNRDFKDKKINTQQFTQTEFIPNPS
jgi:hypothetical protein